MNTNNTTLENNILIAEFMGAEKGVSTSNDSVYTGITVHGMKTITCESLFLKYYNNWNWLMPVVEKIEGLDFHNLSFTFDIHKDIVIINAYGETVINTIPFNSHTSLIEIDFKNSKIETVYNAVIEFIKWYNENSAKKE